MIQSWIASIQKHRELKNKNQILDLKLVPLDELPKETKDCDIKSESELIYLTNLWMKMSWLCGQEGGIGLSAAQVGVNKKMFIVKEENSYGCYVNCEYEKASEELSSSIEGCLSIKDKDGSFRNFVVTRPKRIKVTGKKIQLENKIQVVDFVQEFEGLNAVVFAHEIDHQNNILISDIGQEVSMKKYDYVD